jgi:hypothetical protein
MSIPKLSALALVLSACSVMALSVGHANTIEIALHAPGDRPQIEPMIQASGNQLTDPVLRRGPVYLADVFGRQDDPGRLVIEAHDGRLLLRHPGTPAIRRQTALPVERPSRSPLTTLFDGLFGRKDDVAPPWPPADYLEMPKSKPQVKRLKSKQTPVAQPTAAPGDNKAISLVTPAATPSAASPPSPPTAPVAPSAPTPNASAPKINDLPVAPLE